MLNFGCSIQNFKLQKALKMQIKKNNTELRVWIVVK